MILEDLFVTNRRLGEGVFASIFLGQIGKIKVAAKKLSRSERQISDLMREVSKHKRVQYGKHISYVYGITLKEGDLYMVMEYSERGDLQSYLECNSRLVTCEQKILFCRGILLGLLYCHSMKILHSDIRCSNVLLDRNLEPKLIDIGLSMMVNDIEYYSKLHNGSLYWVAPELFSIKDDETVYQEFIADPYPCDVYSLGATFCEISYDGTTDFIDSDDPGMDIILGNVYPIPKDGFLEEIIDRCCQFERNERISLDECLSALDNVAEKQFPISSIDGEWQRIQQDIQANSKLELPPSFILYRPTINLIIGPSNLSLLEWLCINNCVEAVEYMIRLHNPEQKQLEWLCGISELCKSPEVANFLQSVTQNNELSPLVLSDLVDNHPQQFIGMLIKAGASSYNYNLLENAIEKRHNMVVKAIIDNRNHFKNWAIQDAIKFENTEAVRILANAGIDLEWKDRYTDNTPLITAIDIENIEIVKILLEFGVNIDNKSDFIQSDVEAEAQYRPLYLAALKGNREIVKLLIDAGATIDIASYEWYSLSRSLEQQGNISMTHFIHNSISKKSNLAENNSLCAAIRNKQLDFAQMLINNNKNIDGIDLNGYAPLHWAVITDNEEIVRILVMIGADLDIRTSSKAQNFDSAFASYYLGEYTPLHIAISKGYLRTAKFLIESGADFSAKNELQQAITDTAKEDKKEVEKIIRDYAPVNAILIRRAMKSMSHESIKTMMNNRQVNEEILSEYLCIVVNSGKIDLVEYLLKRGASTNKRYQGKTPLEWAISGRNIQIMRILIDFSADINVSNQDGRTPLSRCVLELRIDMMQYLLGKGADVNTGDKDGNTPIHLVRDIGIAEILINAGADINVKNRYGETPLIRHVKESNTEMVQYLVGKGADLNIGDKDGNTPIHLVRDKGIAEILINAGADINVKNQYGSTPLIHHIRESNTEMVQYLVGKGADVNTGDKDGNAPIHFVRDKEIAEILINAGADINVEDQYGNIPLIQHIKKSSIEMVQYLVGKGADVNARDKNGKASIYYSESKEVIKILINADADVNAKNRYGETPLIHYVKALNTEMVQYLVDKGANVNTGDKDGNMPIHFVRDKEIAEILINASADINVKNRCGSTPLIRHVKESNTEMVQYLVGKGADVSIGDKDGNTPIYYTENKEVIKLLINADADADFNARNKYGRTPLIQNIRESNIEIVQYLLGKGADVNARDKDGNTPIHLVRDKEIAEILTNAGADINIEDQYGRTPLIRHVKESNTEMVQYLVGKGAYINIKDKYGNTPIYYTKNREITKIFINADADVDVNAKNRYGRTPLIRHVKESNTEMVQYLVGKGADVNTGDKDRNAPIHFVRDKEIAEILINAGADINVEDQYGNTPLIQHIKKSNFEMVQYLVGKGADVNARDKNGNTPIYFVRHKGIAEILINAGADINTEDQYGETPLTHYVNESNTEMVQYLMSKGANIKIRDQDGNTPIHLVRDKGIAEILINADLNAKNKYGETLLIYHVKQSNTEMVQYLVGEGANVNTGDKDGNMPIHFVRDKEIAEILINASADINVKNQYGSTPLIQNIRESNTEIVQYLVDKGANVNTRDRNGNAPIHLVRDIGIAEILINAGADINAEDQYRRMALIHRVNESNLEMVQYLVGKGADVNTGDKDGNTPIHLVRDKGIAEILINAGADINVKNQYGSTPLIHHIRESNTEMVQYLVGKGADVNTGDKDGNMPIHFVRDKEIVKILISASANINEKDRHGKKLFNILIKEQNRNLSNSQYRRKKFCELLEYLRDTNKVENF